MSDQSSTQPVEVDVSRWVHRLIVKERAPDDKPWAESDFESKVGGPITLTVHGQRLVYFLAQFEICNEGAAVVLSCDFYDLDGLGLMNPLAEGNQDDEQAEPSKSDENGGADGESEGTEHGERVTENS